MFRYSQSRNQWKGGGAASGSTVGNGECQSFDKFSGKIIQVDLSKINGVTEAFEGRQWLQQCLKDRLPLGWSVQWQPDREKDADNPIALIQFASVDTALLLRTHITKNWLPDVVEKALHEPSFKKICYDGETLCRKMTSSFNLTPQGIIDLEEVCKRKKGEDAMEGKGLKAVAACCEILIRKDSRIARSNWASEDELAQEQIQYAAEEAYFAHHLYSRLLALPDMQIEKAENYDHENQGILSIKPEWEGVIERKEDGLWCKLCEKGPMNVPRVVESHIGGKQHRMKVDAMNGVNEEEVCTLADDYIEKGIITGDNLNGTLAGQFKCLICNAGPFVNLQTVDAHLGSNRHLKKVAAAEQGASKKDDSEPVDKFAESLWNLPDYVVQEDNTLTCTLCNSAKPFLALEPLLRHLGSHKHAKACRENRHEEIMFIKERKRLEYIESGKAVIRYGHTKPTKSLSRTRRWVDKVPPEPSMHTPSCRSQNMASASSYALPEGWEPYKDPNTDQVYYWHVPSETMSWTRPDPPCNAATEEMIANPCPMPPTSKVSRPLPGGWEEFTEPASGIAYYYHAATARTQWEQPTAELADNQDADEFLPPGWIKGWDKDSAAFYYADVQTGDAQWEAPPPYVWRDWRRSLDPLGRAFWLCEELNMHFLEKDHASGWTRFEDQAKRTYWSKDESDIRFFETDD